MPTAVQSLGRPLTKVTKNAAGTVTRASYTFGYNNAGSRLSEISSITGDSTNGTTTYAYDALGRLTSYTPPSGSANTQTYSWNTKPDRASIKIGTAPTVTTTFDAASRPTADSSGTTYTSDQEGRLTTKGGQTMTYDALGRLTAVHVNGTLTATYTYDALDRLRTVTHGTTTTRFRYVGLTGAVAQEINDSTGAVLWNHATDFGGARLYDFTPGGASQRYIGTNGHGDVTWTADSGGSVVSTARYDPFGATVASSGTVPDSRWQGSWLDTSVGLYYVGARWYAPDLGRFLSTDPAAGSQQSPQTLDPYAYGAGDSVGRTDTDGRCYVTSSDYGACATAAQTAAADAAAKANLAAYERRAQALADAAKAKAAADAAAAKTAAEAQAAAHEAAWKAQQAASRAQAVADQQSVDARNTAAQTSGCHPDNAQWADLCAIHGSDAAVAAALAGQEAEARSREEARAAAEAHAQACYDSGNYAVGCQGPQGKILTDAEAAKINADIASGKAFGYMEAWKQPAPRSCDMWDVGCHLGEAANTVNQAWQATSGALVSAGQTLAQQAKAGGCDNPICGVENVLNIHTVGWCLPMISGAAGIPVLGGLGYGASVGLCVVVTGKGDVAVLTTESGGIGGPFDFGLSGGVTTGPMFSSAQNPYQLSGPFDYGSVHVAVAELEGEGGVDKCGNPVQATYGGVGPSGGASAVRGKSTTQIWWSSGPPLNC